MMKSTIGHLVAIQLICLAVSSYSQVTYFDQIDNCTEWSVYRNSYSSVPPYQKLSGTAICSSSKIRLQAHTTANDYAQKLFTLTVGKKYIIRTRVHIFSTSGTSINYYFRLFGANSFNQNLGFGDLTWIGAKNGTTPISTWTTLTFVYIPQATTSRLGMTLSGGNATAYIDWIEIIEDPCELSTATLSGPSQVCTDTNEMFYCTYGVAYNWNGASSPNPFASLGPGTIKVYVATESGCLLSASKIVSAIPVPSITIVPSTTTFCKGDQVTLTATGCSDCTYQWSIRSLPWPPSPLGTQQEQIITVSLHNYTYSVEATSPQGCKAYAHYYVLGKPLPSSSISGDSIFCSGSSTVLTASVGSSYLWSNGATTPSITVSSSGTYTVTVTNEWGCSKVSSPFQVTTSEPETPQINVTQDCGRAVLSTGSATSYQWSNGATTQTTIVSGQGTYTLRITNDYGCVSPAGSAFVTIIPPTNQGSISQSGSLCQGQVYLTAGPGIGYSWGQPSKFVYEEGTYSVSYTNDNNCYVEAQTTVVMPEDCGEGGPGYARKAATSSDESEDPIPFQFDETYQLGIYPNPANEQLLIVLSQTATHDTPIKILDLFGRTSKIDIIPKGRKSINIDISDMSQGVYIVDIHDNRKPLQTKLIIKR